MHLLFLSSNNPSFHHSSAERVVFAALMENMVQLGHQISFATVACPDKPDVESVKRLRENGVEFLGDFSSCVRLNSENSTLIPKMKKVLLPFKHSDYLKFLKPEKTASELESTQSDAILFFWDTWFENLLPYIRKSIIVGYLGRPRYAASMTRLVAQSAIGLKIRVKHWILLKALKNSKKRSLSRAKYFSAMSNICALDVGAYERAGIPCQYIPNTWPDFFGPEWRNRRKAEARERTRLGMLANIGTVTTTGNTTGLTYLAEEILPQLELKLNPSSWEINICGGGVLSETLQGKLKKPYVNLKGFVENIDQEMLANSIFLLMNNAGSYTGGYTRVIYAFSSGACLIAHSNLAKSMPELKHMDNVLLGESADEIVSLICQAVSNQDLRERIGYNARMTYEKAYHPSIVSQKILSLAEQAIKNNGHNLIHQ